MAQHIVVILNQGVPQLQEPQVADSYLLPRDTEIQGNLTISGTVDGRDVAADGALLDTALQPADNVSALTNDAGYTDDQTGAEIKTALFAEADTNNYDDAAVAKLAGVAAGAEVNPAFASQAEAEAGTENTKIMTALRVAQAIAVFSSGLLNKYDGTTDPVPTNDVNDGYSVGSIWMNQTASPAEIWRCVDNSAGTAVWIKTSLTIDELSLVATTGDSDDLIEGVTQLLMTVAERSKLTGIEAGATADQTGAEIKALYEAEANTTVDRSYDVIVDVRNESGGLLSAGDAVYISGYSVGQELVLVDAARSDSLSTMPCEGIILADIADNAEGLMVAVGRVSGVDTSSFSIGDTLYVDASTAGALTATPPTGANYAQPVATVLRVHASLGIIEVFAHSRSQTRSELETTLNTITTGITAYATGGQANAVELTTRFNHVGTVATGGDSVKLPTAVAGLQVTVVNKGANAMDLFPGSGDNINGTGVDTAVSIAAGNAVTLWAADATNWYYA